MSVQDQIRYHATQAFVHLSELIDRKQHLDMNEVGKDVLHKAAMLTHVLSGGEDVREIGSETDTEIIDN